VLDTTNATTGIEVQNDFHGMSIMIDRLEDMTEILEERGAESEPLNILNNIKPRFML